MLCYAILYYTILYYTILYYTILYYTILYYTIHVLLGLLLLLRSDLRSRSLRGNADDGQSAAVLSFELVNVSFCSRSSPRVLEEDWA